MRLTRFLILYKMLALTLMLNIFAKALALQYFLLAKKEISPLAVTFFFMQGGGMPPVWKNTIILKSRLGFGKGRLILRLGCIKTPSQKFFQTLSLCRNAASNLTL
jgi:hypothetical protein